MLPSPVIEDPDVLETSRFHVGMDGMAHTMHSLGLEAVEPALSIRQWLPIRWCRPAFRSGNRLR